MAPLPQSHLWLRDKQRKPGLQQPHLVLNWAPVSGAKAYMSIVRKTIRVLAASRSCFCPWLGRQHRL